MDARGELAEHLGRNYEAHKLHWTNATDYAAIEAAGGPRAFQRDKEALHLYTWRETADWWLPHITFVHDVVPVGASVLDYLASTGWMGLRLTDYVMSYADYGTKCSAFLAWRLKRRGNDAVYGVAKDDLPLHEAVIAFDVANWHKKPLDLPDELAALGTLALLDADSRRVDVAALLQKIREDYTIINHRTVNHYVNLVAFYGGATVEEA